MAPDDDPTDAAPLGLRRWRRRAAIASGTVAAAALATTVAGGWYYSDELLLVRAEPAERPIRIVAVTGTTVTLAGLDSDQPGLVGLEWDDGYARLGADVLRRGEQVIRSYTPYPDVPVVGASARTDGYATPVDLGRVSDLDVREISYAGPLGRYPATYVPAAGPRWVIHVHGRTANRAEAYRLFPAIHRMGYPQLSITYRNDEGAPADPDGEFGLGWTESEDLASAVWHARDHGAVDVVLVGYSMGGAVIGNYLRTDSSEYVAGVVYDSPALSWPDILAFQAKDRGLPTIGGFIAGAAVRVRAGIRLSVMDQVAHADRLEVPVLLFHGTGDATVPVRSSDAFAAARPDLVTFVRPDGVGHVRGWNHDPAAYEAAVTGFLTSLP